MPLNSKEHEARARLLLEHRLRGEPISVSDVATAPTSMDDAYAIQDALDAILRTDHAFRPSGYKIAGTNPASRAHLQIDAPFHGRLYDRLTSQSGAAVPFIADFYRVHEPEIAIEIGRDLDPADAPFDEAAIAAATRAIRPAIEIIGTWFTPWTKAGAPNLASDNAAFGHWIVGAPVSDWSGLDLLDAPIALSVNDEIKATGRGRNVDGGPFGATAWLANALALRGVGLKAGEFITTGSTTTPVSVAAGQQVIADFGKLGRVTLRT